MSNELSIVLLVPLTIGMLAYLGYVLYRIKHMLVLDVPTIGWPKSMPFYDLHTGTEALGEQCFMGHSLWTLFAAETQEPEKGRRLMVENAKKGASIRILLLDPMADDNDQFIEIARAQVDEEGGKRKIEEDIQESLHGITQMRKQLGDAPKGNIEVRVTKRLMYITINRIGDNMIVGNYLQRGLSQKSIHFCIKKAESEATRLLFESYMAEFYSIWDDEEMTRTAPKSEE